MPPFFFTDVDELYRIADRISRHADAARAAAGGVASAIAADRWRGIAADTFAAEATNVLHDLRSAAGRLDDAADALRRHANHIQGCVDAVRRGYADVLIAGGELVHEGSELIHGAGEVLHGAGTLLGHAAGVRHLVGL
jgi:hypothetical protein